MLGKDSKNMEKCGLFLPKDKDNREGRKQHTRRKLKYSQ